MATTATFFIPDRLRGIPLVTGGRTSTTTTIPSAQSSTQKPSTTTTNSIMEPISTSKLKLSADTMKLVQVEKRETNLDRLLGANNPRLTTSSDSSLLFKPSAMTASTANIVRKKVPTTTKKPPTATRKWKTTSTRRAQVSNHNNRRTAGSKLTQMLKASEAPTISTTTISSTTIATITTTTSKLAISGDTTATNNALPAASSTKVDRQMSTPSLPTAPTLARTSQSLSTQPLSQRRTPQQINFPRYTNRLNDASRSAGENWILFNRPDGSLSVFEFLVLFSNIMIIGAIVMVIVMSWIRSLKKKRAQQSTPGQRPTSGEHIQPAASTVVKQATVNQSPQMSAPKERGSKVSTISDGISQRDSPTKSDISHSQVSSAIQSVDMSQPKQSSGANSTGASENISADAIKQQLDEKNQAASNAARQVVGAAHNMASEIKAGGLNMANKAMAIVQPTENNTNAYSENSDKVTNSIKDELMAGGNQRTINRSMSDLSGSGSKLKKDLNEQLKGDSKDATDAQNESAAGTGSAPDLATEMTNLVDQKLDNFKDEMLNNSKQRSNSLESIELPGDLVNSIKRSGYRLPDNVEAPSPNLLLGETERVEPEKKEPSAVQVTKPETKPTKPTKSTKSPEDAPKKTGEPAKTVTADINRQTKPGISQIISDRPQNPMGRQLESTSKPLNESSKEVMSNTVPQNNKVEAPANGDSGPAAQVKNHQVVVNKLDKRKTNLEIVDIRDESVTGKMRGKDGQPAAEQAATDDSSGWISMDGLAVVQPAADTRPSTKQQMQQVPQTSTGAGHPTMSPSEIIESRFHVDYSSKRHNNQAAGPRDGEPGDTTTKQQDSLDSKTEEHLWNDIENELELDNKMKNRKYFVYIVHDGHFTAKKECIARIELPPKRRITLAELRQLIANSQDISLTSLKRNKFKFVTETYRLLNENEDAAVLHQVYPTQGVFLKINIPEQENQSYQFKGRARIPSGSGAAPSSLSHTTISSRRRATTRTGQPRAGTSAATDPSLPAIEVESANEMTADAYGRTRALSSGRRTGGGGPALGAANRRPAGPGGAYRRSKSSVHNSSYASRRAGNYKARSTDRLPSIGRSSTSCRRGPASGPQKIGRPDQAAPRENLQQAISGAATDLSSNVISGAKRLLNTFHF